VLFPTVKCHQFDPNLTHITLISFYAGANGIKASSHGHFVTEVIHSVFPAGGSTAVSQQCGSVISLNTAHCNLDFMAPSDIKVAAESIREGPTDIPSEQGKKETRRLFPMRRG
jgi:hypothetical protein